MGTVEEPKISHSGYVLGHTDRERRRLSLQAALLNPLTDSFLRRAGISAGMRVLELGCGVGEVSLIAARLVGPHGHLHGIDIDPAALETAAASVRSAGHDHVTFEKTDVMEYSPSEQYDAVIGRHILIHTKDALGVLTKVVSMLPDGGLVAFQEYDLSQFLPAYPELPLMASMTNCVVEFFRQAVSKPDIGAQLFYLMQAAGLQPPECRAEIVMDGGPHSLIYEWVTETVISLSPLFEKLGMEPLPSTDGEGLTRRIRDEALSKRGVVFGPLMIGAFARKRSGSGA